MEKLLEFLQITGKLKKLKRKGWVLKKVPNPESVAEHSFRTAVLALAFNSSSEINKEKLVSMALVHDLPEALAGDITPHDKVGKEKKQFLERKAMEKICSKVKNGKKIMKLWAEYSEGKTSEAKLLNQLDKIEMVVQAREYKLEHKNKIKLEEFWKTTKKSIKEKKLKELFDQTLKRS